MTTKITKQNTSQNERHYGEVFFFLSTASLPPTRSGPVSVTSHGIGEKMVPSVFPGTPILQLKKVKNKNKTQH